MTRVTPVISKQEADKVLCDLAQAHTLPSSSYTSEAFLQAEYDYVFRTQWYPIAHEQQVAQPGAFRTINLCGEQLVVVRGFDNKIKVLSRVCLQSNKDLFAGSFHHGVHTDNALGTVFRHRSWVYDLSGQLLDAPDKTSDQEFDPSHYQLQSYRVEIWNGFVLVNLDGQAAPFVNDVTSVNKYLDAYQLQNLKMLSPQPVTFEMQANWKVVVENYIESYHHLAIHRNTFELVSPARTTHVDDQLDNVIILRNPVTQAIGETFEFGLPPIAGLQEENLMEFPVFLMQPCFLVTPAHNQVVWYQLIPDGPDLTYLNAYFFIPESYLSRLEELKQVQQQSVAIHNEDMDACEGVQKGLESAFFQQGRLHPLEKGVWLFNKHILEKFQQGNDSLIG